MKYLLSLLSLLLSGCAIGTIPHHSMSTVEPPIVEKIRFTPLQQLAPPFRKPVVAVYDFPDLTGQRKDRDNLASFSSAVTQGGSTLLVDALKKTGDGQWFVVVERSRVDDLAKERQIVRQTRDEYEGEGANKLEPMLYAEIIFQGGIIGYDTNITSGGAGARYLGIGADTQYRVDQVTVALRVVSTKNGEVLLNTQVSKTIISYGNSLSVFKFMDLGTKLIEGEIGMSRNEANTMAVKIAIEAAVLDIVKQGIEKGYWSYK